ncbi:hypothetical protein ZEAMMB73_Zm00001d003273 [Zea mays]|uniref:Uncharacterized protein n=1 Tax=Zea mays TaxID=4577 RepID=A0A1D6E8B1_MAIZE|nr:hypothetical protein ZEAMMB73_Zm00001d003273 [Zea mays]
MHQQNLIADLCLALGRCALVSRRFHALVPLVCSVFVRVDEPTSGLDNASALHIVGALRAMAEARGRTVLLSIHQPGACIVKMFDSVLLLAVGSVLHHGIVDQLRALLGDAGLHLPPHVDDVEFAIDSVDALRRHARRPPETERAAASVPAARQAGGGRPRDHDG